ncbi:MAG: DegT/DnrJ/EryC1/StrS aminotransferase family protein [Candidatus Eisenbacteria bacterium]
MRAAFLPVALPSIGDAEKQAVLETLDSGWVTTGPRAHELGKRIALHSGAAHGLAVNSATGALHLALAAWGIGPGDEVITSTWTFASTANVVLHTGATLVLVDVDPRTLNLDPARVAAHITPRTRAVIAVDFAGHPADYEALRALCDTHGLRLLADAAHSFGARYRDRPVGTLADATAFSFYAIKNITTGEGGCLVTDDEEFLARAQVLSLHGISKDAWKRYSSAGSWYYEVTAPGYKYNLTDLAAALGLAELDRWPEFDRRRSALAARYDAALADVPEVERPFASPEVHHARHLYTVRLDLARLTVDRGRFLELLKAENIGTTVNFIPVHKHPYYRDTLGFRPEDFPVAERVYPTIFTLPLYPRMLDADVDDVVTAVKKVVHHSLKRS